MTALAEALLAAQRQAIGALSKAFVAGAFETEADFYAALEQIGALDAVDRQYLHECLVILKTYGAPAPAATKAEPQRDPNEPATERQIKYIQKLADERQTTAPDYPLTKDSASKVIEQLQAGTYNPDEWTVPF